MEIVDDEEDVILPNSPLYDYFQDEKSTNFQNELSQTPNSEYVNTHSFMDIGNEDDGFHWNSLRNRCFQGKKDIKRPGYIKKRYERLYGKNIELSTLLKKVRSLSVWLRKSAHYLWHYFYVALNPFSKAQRSKFYLYLLLLTEKKLLIPEDITFLEDSYRDLNESHYEYEVPAVFFVTLTIILSFLLLMIMPSEMSYNYFMSNLYGSTMLMILTYLLLKVIFVLWQYYISYRIDEKVRRVVTDIKNLTGNLKKICTIIQETELIARGFASSSAVGIAERLELSTLLTNNFCNRQLPELRKALFVWTRESFLKYRVATCHLIDSLPLPAECASQYFATMPLEQFGNLLVLDPTCEEEFKKLLETSDNLSLTALKSMQELLGVQISEFLKRFCLCFIQFSSSKSLKNGHVCLDLNYCSKMLDDLNQHHSQLLSSVKEAYVLNRCLNHNYQKYGPLPDNRTSLLHTFNNLLVRLMMDVRSTMMKLNDIEDSCPEDNFESTDSLEDKIAKDYFQQCLGNFEEVNLRLEQCNLAFSECNKFLERQLFGTSPSVPTTKVIAPPVVKTAPLSTLERIADVDRVIEDEVYEAVNDYSDLDKITEKRNASQDEDMVDKKITVPLMKELKKVLVTKAEEHRCREEKAIKAKAVKDPTGSGRDSNEDVNPLISSADSMGNTTLDRKFCGDTEQQQDAYDMEHCQNQRTLDDAENDEYITFEKPRNGDFASFIEAMALQRRQKFNLQNDVYEIDDDDIVEIDDDDIVKIDDDDIVDEIDDNA